MKELFNSLKALIGACIVSAIYMPLGFVYSLIYSIWLSVSLKEWKAFFMFWWRFIDGILAAIASLIYAVGYALDLGWNVNGEMLEDFWTHEENTYFSQKNISVSATIGNLEDKGELNSFGKVFSSWLDFFFNQKRHSIGAWKLWKFEEDLRSKEWTKKR